MLLEGRGGGGHNKTNHMLYYSMVFIRNSIIDNWYISQDDYVYSSLY